MLGRLSQHLTVYIFRYDQLLLGFRPGCPFCTPVVYGIFLLSLTVLYLFAYLIVSILEPEDTAQASLAGKPLANHRETETDLSERRFWGAVVVLAFIVVQIATIAWDIQNPYPDGWDEAQYVSFAHKDISSLKKAGVPGAIKSFLLLDPPPPPGFRLMSLPIALVLGVSPTILRTGSLSSLGVCFLFVCFPTAGIVAT